MVKLAELLAGWKAPEPAVKPVPATPRSQRNQVVNRPTREPVNRQAALIIAPAPWWSRPLPPEPDRASQCYVVDLERQIGELKTQLREAREWHRHYSVMAEQVKREQARVARWKKVAGLASRENEQLKRTSAELRDRLLGIQQRIEASH